MRRRASFASAALACALAIPPASARAEGLRDETVAVPPAAEPEYDWHRVSMGVAMAPFSVYGPMGGEGVLGSTERFGTGLFVRYGAHLSRWFEIGLAAEYDHHFGEDDMEQVRVPMHLALLLPVRPDFELAIAAEFGFTYLWMHTRYQDMQGDALRAPGGLVGPRISGYYAFVDGWDVFADIRGSLMLALSQNGRGYLGGTGVFGAEFGLGSGLRVRL